MNWAKKIIRMSFLAGVLAFTLAIIPSTCLAISYSLTDSTGIPGNQYTLDFTGSTVTINAFTTNGGPTPVNWSIEWLEFKLTPQPITIAGPLSVADVAPTPGTLTLWNFATSANQVNLQKFGTEPQDGFSLIYFTGIVVPGTNTTSGALLDGSQYRWTLGGVNLGGQTLLTAPSFKVGYYDGLNPGGQFFTQQLSQEFTQVPEPATLILLGGGLISLVVISRRRFFK